MTAVSQILNDIHIHGLLNHASRRDRAILPFGSADKVEQGYHSVCVNVLPRPAHTRYGDPTTLMERGISELVRNPARGIIPVGIERQHDLSNDGAFYKSGVESIKEELEQRAARIVVFVLNAEMLSVIDPRNKNCLDIGTEDLGGELSVQSVPPNAIEAILAPEEIQPEVQHIFSEIPRVVGVAHAVEESFYIPHSSKMPDEIRDLPYADFFGIELPNISLPSFSSAISEIVKERFGDVNDLSDTKRPLVFHAVRLPTERDLALCTLPSD